MDKIRKSRFRIMIVVVLLTYCLIGALYSMGLIDEMEAAPDEHIFMRVVLGVFGFMSGISAVYVWIMMLRHWRAGVFESSLVKWTWLIALLGMNVVGGFIYYLAVVELQKGGTKEGVRNGLGG